MLPKFYTLRGAGRYLGLSAELFTYHWKTGKVKHDAVEMYPNGREIPLFSELTLRHYQLDLDAKKAA